MPRKPKQIQKLSGGLLPDLGLALPFDLDSINQDAVVARIEAGMDFTIAFAEQGAPTNAIDIIYLRAREGPGPERDFYQRLRKASAKGIIALHEIAKTSPQMAKVFLERMDPDRFSEKAKVRTSAARSVILAPKPMSISDWEKAQNNKDNDKSN